MRPSSTGGLTPQAPRPPLPGDLRALSRFCTAAALLMVAMVQGRMAQAQTAAPPSGLASAAFPAGEAQLPRVTVSAPAEPVPGERKADGFSARSGQVGVLGERPLLDTPFSVNVLTRELLDSAGVKDLKGLARLDAAVAPSFSGVGYYDALSIRGLSLNNWTNYYKNGLLFPNQAKTPLENVDRVEIQRGLSGFLQGFAAPGGTVNYVTERPTATWQRRAEFRTDPFGTVLPGFDVGGPLTKDGRLGVRVNVVGGRERYFVDQLETDRGFGSIALDWQAHDDVSVQFDAQIDRRDGTTQPSLGPNVLGVVPRGVDPERYLGQRWQTYDTRTREASLGMDWRLSPAWSVQFKANKAQLYRDDFSSNIGAIQANGDFEVFEYKSPGEKRDSRNLELALRGGFDTGFVRHRLVLGAGQRRLLADFGNSVFEPAGVSNLYEPVRIADPRSVAPPVYRAIENRDRGLFVSDFMEFGQAWQLLVGVRRSEVHFFSVFEPEPYEDTVTTPTIALIYKPRANVSLYASYVEGLEQGGSAPVDAANAQAQLAPVTSEQVELGVKADLMDGRLAASAALFEIEVPLAYVDDDTNVFGYYGLRRHRGLELTLAGGVWTGGRLNAGAVFLDAEARDTGDPAVDGEMPNDVAKRQFSLWLDQRLPAPGLSAQLGVRHASRRAAAEDGSLFVPEWTVFDAGLRWQARFDDKRVDLGLTVLNLADKRYFESAAFGQLNFGSTRAVHLSAALEF